MKRFVARLRNPHHEQHYGSILLLGWGIAALAVYPSVLYPRTLQGDIFGAIVAMTPALAHLYSLRALLALRQTPRFQPNMMAAGWTLSYLPVALLAAVVLPWPHAYLLPMAGTVLGLMSFGLLLPGLSPFIAYAVTAKFIRPHESRARLIVAGVVLCLGWLLAGITAEVISSV